jgi:hypothetical protein
VISVLGASTPRSGGSRELGDGLDLVLRATHDIAEALIADNGDVALEHLARVPEIAAVIVHLPRTPDGGDALERIRERHPLMPVLALLDSTSDRSLIQRLKCEWCELPANARQIRHFVLRAQAFLRVQHAWRSWLVEYGAKTYGLSSRATALLAQAVKGSAPGLLMAELGISHHTLVAQVSRLLTAQGPATDLARADDLLARLLAQTSLHDRDQQRADEVLSGVAGEPELRH